MPEAVLSTRALNRALLARQFLLERSDQSIEGVLQSVGGLQTQYAPSGYIGLWSRMEGFERGQLTDALASRRVIQGTLMRATIHMVAAADYWPMEVAVRAARREWWLRAAGSQVTSLDSDGIERAIRDELADGPLRQKDLSARLKERGYDGPQSGINILADIVRVPPSGTWDQRRADLYGLAADWLSPPKNLTERDGVELLIRRYLGGFGPAAVADVANWMGVNIGTVREVAATLELGSFRDEGGRELVDLPDAPLLDPDTPAPAAVLARLGCNSAGSRQTDTDPAGGVPAAGLQHQDAALGEHLPARRPGGRDMALREGRPQPRTLPEADPSRARRTRD